MSQQTLDERRQAVLDKAFELYDFGDYEVSENGRDGWEHTMPGREYSCVVWMRAPEASENEDDIKANLTAVFQSNDSDLLTEFYASIDGMDLGHRRFEEDGTIFETAREYDAYVSGKSAFEQGLSQADNPYGSLSDYYMVWENGWTTAAEAENDPDVDQQPQA